MGRNLIPFARCWEGWQRKAPDARSCLKNAVRGLSETWQGDSSTITLIMAQVLSPRPSNESSCLIGMTRPFLCANVSLP
jgi:hypothetical protein